MGKESKKKKLILEESLALFSRFGARRVTVEEICKTAGVSKVTFYKYFNNKADLIRSIGDALTTLGFAKFDEIAAMDIPYPKKIDLMTSWRVDFFSGMNEEFIRELLILDEVVEQTRKRFLKNIADAQKKGEIRHDLSPEFIWLVTEKLTGIVQDGTWKTVFPDYKTFQEQLRTLIFHGLLERKDTVVTKSGD